MTIQRNTRERTLLILCAGLFCLLAARSSKGAIRPFVFGGGQSIRISTETTNDLLDKVTLHDRVRSWHAGAGLRIFPGDGSHPAPWEFRFRYGRGAGDLPDNFVQVTHESQRNPYSFTVSETYDQRFSIVGVSFLSRVIPQVGAFIGPALQTVTYHGKLTRSGTLPDPRYNPLPLGGKETQVVRYGQLDLGLQLAPRPAWPALEIFWVPSRFDLSTTRRTTNEGGWTPHFPDFNASVGASLVYDINW